jgi:predicted hydrocarbon binding protein
MKTIALVYKFDKKLNLQKIQSEVGGFRFAQKSKALFLDIDSLRMFVLSNGIVRLAVPAGDASMLVSSTREAGQRINAIINAIALASGQENPKSIKMDMEEISGNSVLNHSYEDFRPELKLNADVRVVNSLVVSIFEILGRFEAKRVQAQAGEILGRAAATGIAHYAEYDELYSKISKGIEELGLGEIKFEKPELADGTGFVHSAGHVASSMDHKHHPVIHNAIMSEGYISGLMVYGEPVCELVRGYIRGAFCQFTGIETMFVEETECWGRGDIRCKFVISSSKT